MRIKNKQVLCVQFSKLITNSIIDYKIIFKLKLNKLFDTNQIKVFLRE